MPIRILDAATVGRIAAGEVVERPASVVKELVENSLDAGATAVTVEIRGGGIDFLRVTDNGCGIEPGQVRLAFENHATSKLRNADQLNDIRTLGFRGEALPSIASVSHVELTTRAKNQDSGTRLNVDGGENLRVKEAGCPEGTTFIMKDLFYNVPVRRAFLKKPAYEGARVADTMTQLMLGNPKVSMRFINNGNTVYHTYGDGKLRHAVFAVYGKATAEKMIEMDASEGGTRLFGMIGVGELAKTSRAHQMFFINGRSVRCALLSKVLEQVCKSRVTIGMYPMCALNLILPPNAIDVNVHPNKLEVRFRDEVMTRVVVEKLLQSAFEGEKVLEFGRDAAPVRSIERVATVREITPEELKRSLSKPAMPELPVRDAEKTVAAPAEKPVQTEMFARPERRGTGVLRENDNRPGSVSGFLKTDRGTEMEAVTKPERAAERPSFTEEKKLTLNNRPESELVRAASTVKGMETEKPAPEKTAAAPEIPAAKPAMPELPRAEKADTGVSDIVSPAETAPKLTMEHSYRVIGVALKTYILVEVEDTLLLIDQHAAHERLRYEMYMRQLEEGVASQQLLTPMIIRVSAREMALIQENMEALTEAGYTVEPFGDHDIQVRAVPHVLGRAELKPVFMETINSLNRLKSVTLDARRAEIMQMACKSAVKGGDALADSEIDALIREMLETGAPPTCPHGRPVVRALTRRDLEKMFKRIQ